MSPKHTLLVNVCLLHFWKGWLLQCSMLSNCLSKLTPPTCPSKPLSIKTHTNPVLWDNSFHTAKLLEIKPLGWSQGTSQPEHHLSGNYTGTTLTASKNVWEKKRVPCPWFFLSFARSPQALASPSERTACWNGARDLKHRPRFETSVTICEASWQMNFHTNTAGLALMLRTLCMPARGIQNCLRVILEYPTASQSFQHENSQTGNPASPSRSKHQDSLSNHDCLNQLVRWP